MKRATLMLLILPLVSAGLAAADLSGKWTFSGDIQGNPVTLNCALQQNAEAKLSGPCDVNGGESTDLAGDVTDAAIKFSITVQGYTLNYAGSVNGDNVSGNIEVAGTTGTFSGQRAK